MRVFLWKIGVPLTAFGKWAHDATEAICVHGQRLAEEAGRPCLFLEQNSTAATGNSKEDMARRIAERDGITDGLVCVFRSLEPCWSFDLKRNHRSHRLEIVRRRRKCIHLYFYFVDPQFGFMHVTGPR